MNCSYSMLCSCNVPRFILNRQSLVRTIVKLMIHKPLITLYYSKYVLVPNPTQKYLINFRQTKSGTHSSANQKYIDMVVWQKPNERRLQQACLDLVWKQTAHATALQGNGPPWQREKGLVARKGVVAGLRKGDKERWPVKVLHFAGSGYLKVFAFE